MSWDLDNIKQGLAVALDAIPLRTYVDIPEKVSPPCAILGDGEITYDDTLGEGDTAHFMVLVVTSRADTRASQKELNAYRNRTGQKSIKAAVETDRRLTYNGSSTVEDVAVTQASAPQSFTIGGVDYIGVEFTVEALIS